MGYLFLTGATGLLGSYLIRDLTQRGVQLALLVRPSRMASAQLRVEQLVARWEDQAGYAMPRPVVFAGDLTRPDLGLDAAATKWVSENCTALMHNAASLTFVADSPDSEPWRSNLHGTRNVLDFAKATGIREFHHVSTAYVCGKRRDRVFESELDVGQEHGNDYEVSKFQSETMVRQAEFLDEVTVYRPAIILGDSQTGFTTTYHGFYVPLKLVASLITKTAGISAPREIVMAGIRMASQRLRDLLKLNGDEAKNFVPVDWVSAVMAKVYADRSLHGETYHLTPRERVPVTTFQDVMEQVFLHYTEKQSKRQQTNVDWSSFEKMFLDGMAVYRSYWGDDPIFDDTNTRRAAPEFPCPDFDEAMFMRMCQFAIEANFGWPIPRPPQVDFDVHDHMSELTAVAATNGQSAVGQTYIGLQVNGRGGGQWELQLRDGEIVAASQGMSSRCGATYYLNSKTFEKLAKREADAKQAIRTGGVLIEGSELPSDELAAILQSVANRRSEMAG